MKAIFKKAVLAVAAVLMSVTLFAQDRPDRISREELAVKQAEHICRTLAFDKETGEKFKQAYYSYQEELWALGPRPEKPKSGKPNKMDKPGKPDEEQIQQRFERSQQVLDLRKKYYDIYSAFLTQEQISRVYEIEHDMMHHLSKDKRHGHGPAKANRNAHK